MSEVGSTLKKTLSISLKIGLGLLVLVLLFAGYAFWAYERCHVSIENRSGHELTDVVLAVNSDINIGTLKDKARVTRRVYPGGEASITISFTGQDGKPTKWRGGYIEGKGGYHPLVVILEGDLVGEPMKWEGIQSLSPYEKMIQEDSTQENYWRAKVKLISRGMSQENVEKILPPLEPTHNRTIRSHGGYKDICYWLDDYWYVFITFRLENSQSDTQKMIKGQEELGEWVVNGPPPDLHWWDRKRSFQSKLKIFGLPPT